MNIETYYDIPRFVQLLPQERACAAAGVPQLEGEDTSVKGYVVETTSGNYEWLPDDQAPQTAKDYIDALSY